MTAGSSLVGKVLRRFAAMRAVSRARVDSHRRLAAAPIERILVICYGNIYRSAFLGRYLNDALQGVVEVRSAGFHPVGERPCPERHVAASARLGVDLQAHRSAVLQKSDLEWADTIVLMDRHNWDALQKAGADSRKYLWAGALAEGPIEVVDPYELTDDSAAAITQRLQQCGRALVDALRSARAK